MELSEIIGYHGTSKENAIAIVKNNFRISENPDDWLGCGVYFFVEGISDPVNSAKEWAEYKAWNGKNNPLLYSKYTILSIKVVGGNILDTRIEKDLKALNSVRDKLQNKHAKHWRRSRKFSEDDRILWDLAADFMQLEIIIHNLYIKNKTQRIKKITSNIPNVTVMCVKKVENIDLNTISEVKI